MFWYIPQTVQTPKIFNSQTEKCCKCCHVRTWNPCGVTPRRELPSSCVTSIYYLKLWLLRQLWSLMYRIQGETSSSGLFQNVLENDLFCASNELYPGINTPVICTYALPALTWRWLCWGSLRVCGEWHPGHWRWPAWLWTRSRTLAGSGWRCIPGWPWQNAASRVCRAGADGTAPSGRHLSPALRGKQRGWNMIRAAGIENMMSNVTTCCLFFIINCKISSLKLFCSLLVRSLSSLWQLDWQGFIFVLLLGKNQCTLVIKSFAIGPA